MNFLRTNFVPIPAKLYRILWVVLGLPKDGQCKYRYQATLPHSAPRMD